jgi:hypothetical protein
VITPKESKYAELQCDRCKVVIHADHTFDESNLVDMVKIIEGVDWILDYDHALERWRTYCSPDCYAGHYVDQVDQPLYREFKVAQLLLKALLSKISGRLELFSTGTGTE